MPRKSSVKSSVKTRRAPVPQPHGGALVPGAGGGTQPGAGRPPQWLKDRADNLLADPECWSQVEAILRNKDHSMFGVMWGKLADRAAGKPKESVDLNLSGEVTVKQEWTFGKKKVAF